jgi:hypothetical protein
MHINRSELFDADAMEGLLKHVGIPKEVKTQLQRYKRRRVDGNKVMIEYDFPTGLRHHKKGRVYPQPYLGLTVFRSDVCAALAQKYYSVIDIKNCQPVLLSQIADLENLPCPALKEYIANRGTIRDEIEKKLKLTKDESKEICIAVLFGGLRTEHEILPRIHLELKELSRLIVNKYPDYLDLSKISAEKKKKDNPLESHYKKDLTAGALAHYVQNQERLILEQMVRWCDSNGYSADVLQHDACFVRKIEGDPFPSSRLEEIEGAVLEKTGYKISLDIKALEHTFDFTTKTKYISSDILINDSWAAEKFYPLVKDLIVKKDGVLWGFDEADGTWKNSVDHLVHQQREKLVWKQMMDMGPKTSDYGGNVRNIAAMLKLLPNFVPEGTLNPKSSIGKLLFKNGIYDFDTREFSEEFDPSIVFFGRINRDFLPTRNAELETMIHKILFEDPYLEEQKEQALFYKTALARAIYGDYRAKRCYITVGRANCGRGLLTAVIRLAFEGFVGIFNADNLLFNSRSGEGAAKKNSWLVPLAHLRLCISNEIELTGRYMDSNRLKTLCGGGDEIEARQNYVNESVYEMLASFFLLANDVPAIKPADEGLMNRVCVNELRKTYCAAPNHPTEVLEDRTLKDKFSNPEWLSAFFWILADSWTDFTKTDRVAPKPAGMIADAQEWIEAGTSIKSVLEQGYVITKKEEDWVLSSEVAKYLKEKGCKDSETKIGREVSRLTGFLSIDKKLNQTTKKVKRGLKKIEDELNTIE